MHAVCGTMLTVLKKRGPSSFGVHAIYMRRRLLAESLAKACLGHCTPQAHGIDALVQHICNGRGCCFGFASKDEKGCTTKKNHRSFKELPQSSGGGRAGGRYAAAGVDAPAAAAGSRGE